MNVLVTGAGGLTAGAIVATLARAGHQVVGVGRHVSDSASMHVGDCRDAGLMSPLLHAADAFVHVAGIAIAPEVAAIDAIRAPRTVVVVSSAGVYSRHRASAAAYRTGEAAVTGARPDAVLVRPTMIYGSDRDRNVHHLIRFASRWRSLPLVGPGHHRVQPVHFEDLARAVAALVERPARGGVIDAGGGDVLTVRTMLETILRALGQRPRLIRLPIGGALAGAALIDAVRGSRWRERIERLSEDRVVDNSALHDLTRLVPRTFAEGISEEIAEMGLAPR